MFGKTLTVHTLVTDLISRGLGGLSWDELEALQEFVNCGKTMMLLGEYPELETILTVHTSDGSRNARAVLDIVIAYIHEGGQVGSPQFRDLITNMVKKNYLKTTVITALESGDFLSPGKLPKVNSEGVVEVE
jgi:hypothetical protein